MAVSVAKNRTDTVGRYSKYTTGTITFDSSYPTGGEALLPTDVGLSSKVEFISVSPAGGYIFEYDYSNEKVKAFNPTSDVTAPTVAKEVANSSNLSTVTARYIAFGY
jgi:hypothetical protein